MGGSMKGRKEPCSWSWLNRGLSHLERPVYSRSIMALIFWSLLSNSIQPHTQRLTLSPITHGWGPGSLSRLMNNARFPSPLNPSTLNSDYHFLLCLLRHLAKVKIIQMAHIILIIYNCLFAFNSSFPHVESFAALIGEDLCFILHFVLDPSPHRHHHTE